MDVYRLMSELSKSSKVSMIEISDHIGVSPQSFYRSLHGGISLEKFVQAVERTGNKVVIIDKEKKVKGTL